MDKIPSLLRWILMVPLSIASFYIMKIIGTFGSGIYAFPGSFFSNILNITVEGTICVSAMIFTAYYVAPKNKKTVIISLSILIGILSVASTTILLTHNNLKTPLWQSLLSSVLTITTCIYTCVSIFKNYSIDNIDSIQNNFKNHQNYHRWDYLLNDINYTALEKLARVILQAFKEKNEVTPAKDQHIPFKTIIGVESFLNNPCRLTAEKMLDSDYNDFIAGSINRFKRDISYDVSVEK